MLSFDAPLFAWAGLAAAVVPVLIHWFNRRRYRQISWAAMDFLRQAVARSQRFSRLRDVWLLAIRCACPLLLGLALARPAITSPASEGWWRIGGLVCGAIAALGAILWGTVAAGNRRRQWTAYAVALLAGWWCWSSGIQVIRNRSDDGVAMSGSRRQPIHAVLLIDNSRSMGAESLGVTLLDHAKRTAREFLSRLPTDSRLTVIPLAGSDEPISLSAERYRDEMERSIDRLPLTDATENLRHGLELANQACRKLTELPVKRLVLLTDLQASAFRDVSGDDLLAPWGGLQIVPVGEEAPRNLWIKNFHLEDGLAGAGTPVRFLAQVMAAGGRDPVSALLRLVVDDVEVASQTLEISPGQSRDVAFTYQFDEPRDPSRPNSAAVELFLQPDTPLADQLPADNRSTLMAPVVASLPVVFVDEYGDEEDLSKGRIGETYALRHLLAPRLRGASSGRSVIRPVHVRQEQLTEDLLRDARLVIMAGVERPEDCVPKLREYLLQGGPLVLLAGGRFNPSAWQELAWHDGQGILPVPLKPGFLGETPEESAGPLQSFFAAFESMQHDDFIIEQEDPEQLAAIYNETPFFKAIQADAGPDVLASLLETDRTRFTAEQEFLDRIRNGDEGKTPAAIVDADSLRQARQLAPTWWTWRVKSTSIQGHLSPAKLAQREQPRVLAEFRENHLPFVVDRRIGAGRVVLLTSSITSNWNLLRASGAMYLFHRMTSSLIKETFPVQNFETAQRIVLPVDTAAETPYQLMRPSGRQETLTPELLDGDVPVIQIRSPVHSGVYRVGAAQQTDAVNGNSGSNVWRIAVTGPAAESDLTRISPSELTSQIGRDDIRILDAGETISLEGASQPGRGLGKWSLLTVLIGLLSEMAILSAPVWKRSEAGA